MKLINPYENGGTLNLKGQLHCHTTNSDGADSPAVLVTAYKDAGYDFITITDHNYVTSNPFPANSAGITWLADSIEEITTRHIAAYNVIGEATATGTQDAIDYHLEHTDLISLPHPYWRKIYNIPKTEMVSYYDYKFIEVFNAVVEDKNSERHWDYVLSAGKRIFGMAVDDCHAVSASSSFNAGWVIVNVDSNDAREIRDSLRNGNFYASTGNDISIVVEDKKIKAFSTNASTFSFIGAEGNVLRTCYSVTSASYTVRGDELYVRIKSVKDSDSTIAWSQPIFLEEEEPSEEDILIKILNSSNETMAILQNVTNPIISEEINREFTFSFATVIDNDKSNYVNYQHKVEVEDNYFNIVYTEEERTQDGIFINAQCEHVSYELISATLTSGFTATGPFSAVATTLLSGTDFTLGTIQITASQTISVNESTNKRYVLMQLAALYSGELKFDKYVISLYTQRGTNRGVQFRYRKNLVGVKRIIDNRKKVEGLPATSYQVSAAELEFEQGYINAGVSALEHHELGDTVKTIDDDLNLDTSLRIVKESHDVNQRMQGQVEISNFVDDLADTLTTIQTTSVSKDNVYNGCSIGPELGFVATRSDNLARAIMNATDGIKIQKGDTATGTWTDVIYLDTSGNGTFTGFILASQLIGGSIVIGSGSNTFNANGTNGIWLGDTAFATAPFSVTLSGAMTVTDATITGGTIRSAASGGRIELSGNHLYAYDSNGYARIEFFPHATFNYYEQWFRDENGTQAGTLSGAVGSGHTVFSVGGTDRLIFGAGTGAGQGIYFEDNSNVYLGTSICNFNSATLSFNSAIINALLTTSVSDHNHGIPNGTVLQTVTGTITWAESGGHAHIVTSAP